MKTPDQYLEKLQRIRPNVQVRGQIVDRIDPYFMPGINTISLALKLAQLPETQGVMTAFSPVLGEEIISFYTY